VKFKLRISDKTFTKFGNSNHTNKMAACYNVIEKNPQSKHHHAFKH